MGPAVDRATTVKEVLADRPLAPVTTIVWTPGVASDGIRIVTEKAPAALARKVAMTTGVLLNVVVRASFDPKPLPERTTSWPGVPWFGFTCTDGALGAAVVEVAATRPGVVVAVPAGAVVLVLGGVVLGGVELDVVVAGAVVVVGAVVVGAVVVVVVVLDVVEVDEEVDVELVDVELEELVVDEEVDVELVDDVEELVDEVEAGVTTTDSLASLQAVATGLLLASPL
jgi:hypothetical protein